MRDPASPVDWEAVQQLYLEKVRQQIAHLMTIDAVEDLEVDAWMDPIAHAVGLAVRRSILGLGAKRIRIDERWPADWWQAFKERWLPTFVRWGLLRPVEYRSVFVDRQVYAAVCPHHVPFCRDNGTPEVHVAYLAEMDWALRHGWDPHRNLEDDK